MGKRIGGFVERAASYCVVSALVLVFCCAPMTAQTAGGATQAAATEHDGQHDFDFALGSWKAHLKRLEHPLTGSKAWVEFDGTFVARKAWGGRSTIEEVELNTPGGHIEGLTLRLYNTQTHQWSIYWATAKTVPWTPVPKSVNSKTDAASSTAQTH